MSDRFSLSGRIAVVTGGYGVIGGTIASSLAEAGVKVAIVGRRREAAQEKVDEIGRAGGTALTVAANVVDEAEVRAACDEVLRAWGQVDILINAAGGSVPAARNDNRSIFDVSMDAFDEVLRLNLHGTVVPSMVFGRAMAEGGSGCIVNISSMAATLPLTGVMGYSIAKAGIENMTRWLAMDLARRYGAGLRVNAIAPGFFLGNQNRAVLVNPDGSHTSRGATVIGRTPMGRFGRADELVGACPLSLQRCRVVRDGRRYARGRGLQRVQRRVSASRSCTTTGLFDPDPTVRRGGTVALRGNGPAPHRQPARARRRRHPGRRSSVSRADLAHHPSRSLRASDAVLARIPLERLGIVPSSGDTAGVEADPGRSGSSSASTTTASWGRPRLHGWTTSCTTSLGSARRSPDRRRSPSMTRSWRSWPRRSFGRGRSSSGSTSRCLRQPTPPRIRSRTTGGSESRCGRAGSSRRFVRTRSSRLPLRRGTTEVARLGNAAGTRIGGYADLLRALRARTEVLSRHGRDGDRSRRRRTVHRAAERR